MRTKKKSRFGLGLLIYVLVFALLAAAALVVFRQYLAAYEESRVTTALHSHLDRCTDGTLTYQWGTALGKLSADRSEEDANRKWAQEKIRNATIREQITSNSSEKTYGLYDENGFCFSTVTLQQTEKGRWGFAGWKVVDESVDLEPYTTEVSAEIPSDYSVEIGGKKLDWNYITEKNLPYEILKPLEDYLKDLPTKVRYQYGPVLGAGEATILDSKGQTVPEELQTEHHYLDTASAADRARIKDFVERYLEVYLPFADDLEHRGMGYFDAVYQMIIHGGEIERRIRQAIDGLEYGNVLKLEILSVDLDCCTDLGGGRFFTDFSYHIRTYGLTDPTEETYRMRLLLKEEYGTLYAEQMYLS